VELTKLQDSISILITLQAASTECLNVIKKEKANKQSIIHAFADSQLILLANSFMDEWDNLGKLVGDQRVLKVLKVASPFTKRINKWSDLGLLRNTLVAHGFRKKGENILVGGYEAELNIPNSFPDRMLLCGCIFCATQILIAEFTTEYNQLIAHLKTVEKPRIRKGIATEAEAKKELDELIGLSVSVRSTIEG
jgi:hypothetical protein